MSALCNFGMQRALPSNETNGASTLAHDREVKGPRQ